MPPPTSPGHLRATWLGPDFGFWIDVDATVFEINAATRAALDLDTRVALADRPVDVDLRHELAPADVVPMLRVPTSIVVGALLDAPPRAWTPSLAWLHRAVAQAAELVAGERVRPSLRPVGLRWEARWNVIRGDDEAAAALALHAVAPPAVFATFESPDVRQVEAVVDTLVDEVVRSALSEAEWRPPLERSRSAGVVALRRVSTALAGADAVFLGDSPAHEMAFADWSKQLSELAGREGGAPPLRFFGRLTAPTANSEPWFLGLEVIGDHETSTPFAEIWSPTADPARWGGAAALVAVRAQLRDLVDRLSGQFSVFADLSGAAQPDGLPLLADDVASLVSNEAAIERLGLRLLVPDTLDRTTARLTAAATPLAGRRSTEGYGLISVDWGVALGDIDLSETELRELAESKADVVALRDRWVHVDRRALRRLLADRERRQVEDAELTPSEFLQRSATLVRGTDDTMSADGWIATLLAGLPDHELQETSEPPGFVGALRPYQRRALSWLRFLGELGLGGCLADDMGLGKTPTALAHLLERTLRRLHDDLDPRPHLVICPVSVVHNWAAELARFTPELSVSIAHGPSRGSGDQLIEALQKHDVVITTYGTTPRIVEELVEIDWDVVVLDEAQTVKNHQTNAAQAIRELSAHHFVALTGTPIENRLTELWSILDALNPGMLGGITWFRTQIANPIEQERDDAATATLRRLTAPFVLRRTKADKTLVPDLPDKVEQIAWATLTVEQAALYRAVVDDFAEQLESASGMERRGLVLATLTRLKQVCNHPAHFLGEADSDAERSGKLQRFDELVTSMLDADERMLVFTQYRAMGDLLVHHLADRYQLEVPFLHGGTAANRRQRMVDDFQNGRSAPVQLVSLRAGGTGLNLTAASRVIHYDRWWNPAVEDQATDRTWRIGQDQTVFVHKLVCQGTLEERIDALLDEKRELAASVVGTGDQWLTELSTDELRALVRLDGAEIGQAS